MFMYHTFFTASIANIAIRRRMVRDGSCRLFKVASCTSMDRGSTAGKDERNKSQLLVLLSQCYIVKVSWMTYAAICS